MLRKILSKAPVSAAILICCVSVFAQEGYPLDGTWRGVWGAADSPTPIVIVMKWNGRSIDGQINPGPRAIQFDHAELDPSVWKLTIEATDPAGNAIVIEGVLENIGSYNRSIDGSWTQGGIAHEFSITRE